jgi:hypothetical protein
MNGVFGSVRECLLQIIEALAELGSSGPANTVGWRTDGDGGWV